MDRNQEYVCENSSDNKEKIEINSDVINKGELNNAYKLDDFTVDEIKFYFERLKANNKDSGNNSRVNYISLLNKLKNDFCNHYIIGNKSPRENKSENNRDNIHNQVFEYNFLKEENKTFNYV